MHIFEDISFSGIEFLSSFEKVSGRLEVDVKAVDHGVGEHAVHRGQLAHQVERDDQLWIVNLEDVDEVSTLPRVSWKLKLRRELNSRVRESRPHLYLLKFHVTKIRFTVKKSFLRCCKLVKA